MSVHHLICALNHPGSAVASATIQHRARCRSVKAHLCCISLPKVIYSRPQLLKRPLGAAYQLIGLSRLMEGHRVDPKI